MPEFALDLRGGSQDLRAALQGERLLRRGCVDQAGGHHSLSAEGEAASMEVLPSQA